MKIATISEMRSMDRTAVETYGIPELMLMENAGIAAWSVLLQETGRPRGRRFVVLCGSGNNGGDGFVVARKLHAAGARVTVALAGAREKISGISATNLGILDRCGVPMETVSSVDAIRSALSHCDVIVDALLGTGISSEVRGVYRELIEAVNAVATPVLSLDIPSGVHGDTGQIMGSAVKAEWTVTFGLPKIGNLLYPGAAFGGRLFLSTISFPPRLSDDESLQTAVNRTEPLPPRDPDGHKGSFGDALFVAGASGYFGAPCFSALAMLKAGGGYARLAAPASIVPFLAPRAPEAVFVPQRETGEGSIAAANRVELLSLAGRCDLTVVGPGLSLHPETARLVRELTAAVNGPLLLDGDGITAVSRDPDCLRERTAPSVLTPHPGEMSRLTGRSVEEIVSDRVAAVRNAARDLGAVIVLKGGRSLVGYPDGRVLVNLSGNDGMATAGSGDVLTGVVAAMVGLGLPLDAAVAKAVFLHGVAGDLAAASRGADGMTAVDILEHLPAALAADRSGFDERMRRRYEGAERV
jgi:NAD(P)H-hydrate epimerase